MSPVGSAGEASGRDAAARLEDRLTSLEADLSHTTAANEAMSSIIDQVRVLSRCLFLMGCADSSQTAESDSLVWVQLRLRLVLTGHADACQTAQQHHHIVSQVAAADASSHCCMPDLGCKSMRFWRETLKPGHQSCTPVQIHAQYVAPSEISYCPGSHLL